MVSWALFAFFVFGWAYYMTAGILMHGTIFKGFREYLEMHAGRNRLCAFLSEMLECLRCTATEAALWTLGLTCWIIGSIYRIPSHAVSMAAGRSIVMPFVVEVILALAMAFAISLAVAGEAWTINLIAGRRHENFERLREEYAERENKLLERNGQLEEERLKGADIDLS